MLSVVLCAVVKVLAKKNEVKKSYRTEAFQQLTSTDYESFLEGVCLSSPSQ